MNVQPNVAIAFLRVLDPTGRHFLVSFSPETGKPVSGVLIQPGADAAIADWMQENAHRNLYFTVNEVRADIPPGTIKPRKEHIDWIRAVVADLDPAGGTAGEVREQRAELFRIAEEIEEGEAPSTVTWDTGNGVQFMWTLTEKLDAKVYGIDAEELGRGIAIELDGDNVFNRDRILRLPGSINHATPEKRAKGLVGGPVSILVQRADAPRYTLDELEQTYEPQASPDAGDQDAGVQAALAELDWNTAQAGPTPELVARLRAVNDPHFSALVRGEASATPKDPTGSGWRAALVGAFRRRGFSLNDYAAWVVAFEPGQPREGGLTPRVIARDWARVGGQVEAAQERTTSLFGDLSGQEIDTSMFPAPVPESFDTYDLLATTAPAPVIQLIDPADWYGREPNVKEWYVEAFVPRGEVTMLTGKGGVGKSLLALQLLIAVALGIPFLGLQTRRAKCLGFFCEDDPDVLHARVRDICRALGRDERELSGWLYLVSRKYDDNLLCTFDRHGSGVVLKATPLFEELVRVAKELGVEVSCLDTIADIFGGDEINRQQVRQFVQGCAGRLAAETGGACLMLGHPSRAGEQNGEGTSGSTAWHGSVRSRFYLDHIGDEGGLYRELTTQKSNYGPAGAKWKLMWKAGVLEVVTASRAGSEGAPEITGSLHRIILDAVSSANRDGVRLGLGKTSKFKAEPTLRRREPGPLAPYSAEEVEEALQQLVALGAIVEAEIGRDSSRRPIMSLKAVAETAGEADISSEEGGLFD